MVCSVIYRVNCMIELFDLNTHEFQSEVFPEKIQPEGHNLLNTYRQLSDVLLHPQLWRPPLTNINLLSHKSFINFTNHIIIALIMNKLWYSLKAKCGNKLSMLFFFFYLPQIKFTGFMFRFYVLCIPPHQHRQVAGRPFVYLWSQRKNISVVVTLAKLVSVNQIYIQVNYKISLLISLNHVPFVQGHHVNKM